MGQSAAELRREIEATRAELGGTLDAIGDRVSPGRIVERKKNRMTAGVRSVKERVMGTASHGGHMIADQSSHAVGAVRGGVDSMREGVREGVGSVREGVMEGVHGARDAVQHAPQQAIHRAEGTPIAAGAIAIGIGFLAAALIPPSRKEQQMAQQLVDRAEPLKEGLTGAAKEVAEHMREPAQQAMQEVRTAASDAAQSLRDTATEAASTAKDEASGVAQQVKSDAQSARPGS